jgi:hypothetical protein
MLLILQTWCQIWSRSSSLRYLNCGPGHIQCNYSSAYSGCNIQLNLSALLLEICRHYDAQYTANWVPNIAHTNQFTLCELWSRTYTKYFPHRIFRLQYSTECICAAIGDASTIQCSIYCILRAKYSAHPPVWAMWTVVPATCNVIIAPNIQVSIFSWTYLLCYWRYLDNSMRVILEIWC